MSSLRAFICVSPGEERAREIAGFASGLAQFPGYKWVPPERMHITLKFLGESSAAQIQKLDTALSRLGGFRPFEIGISGVGAFPNMSRPRVIWLGVGTGSERLEKLAVKIDSAAARCGYEPEARRFHPHITLARASGEPVASPDELTRSLEAFPAVSWTCRSFILTRSVLTRHGPVYTPVREYPFD
jgi:2'-5' RNA ligase